MKSIYRLSLFLILASSASNNARLYNLLEPFMSERNKRNWQELFNAYNIESNVRERNNVTVNGLPLPASDIITLKDISGAIAPDILDLIEQIKNPEHFTQYGIQPPKGILFIGAPGTGKTMMARAIAGETGSGFFQASGSEFIELYVGVGASRVRMLFEQAKNFIRNNPGKKAIVFIDEIDAIGGDRNNLAIDHPELRQTLNELLNQMDGFKAEPNIIIIAATNTVEMLDPALKRSGRFDIHINFKLPDHAGRVAILTQYINQLPAQRLNSINIEELAQLTLHCNHADLKNLVNYAAKIAMREQAVHITQDHFKRAIKQIHEQRRH